MCLSLAAGLSMVLATPAPRVLQDPKPATQTTDSSQALAQALRTYFAATDARGPELAAVLELAVGHEAELIAVLRQKAFLAAGDSSTRRGLIRGGRFVDDAAADNPALFVAPAAAQELQPLIVYVPDAIDSLPYGHELERDGKARGYHVLLVPDERRDNLWAPSHGETERHTGPLRDLLLHHAIDPDRVYLVGSGRGGHATWDIGLMRSELWAGIYPCNGGLIHEGGFKATGGVFVENGKDLTIFTVYNTTFDHGIDSCRNAARLLRQWGTRFEVVEEPKMRLMGIAEAMTKLSPVARRAHPRTITKRFNHLADGTHHWLQALDRRPAAWDPTARITLRGSLPADRQKQMEMVWAEVQRQCARLEGTVAGNAIRVEAQGVGRLRVWLDPELIDFAAKVTITLNGKPQRTVRQKRRLAVMLQRVHETGDTSHLYQDFVDLSVPR